MSVDYVDMSSMMKDIISMKADLQTLKEARKTTSEVTQMLRQVTREILPTSAVTQEKDAAIAASLVLKKLLPLTKPLSVAALSR